MSEGAGVFGHVLIALALAPAPEPAPENPAPAGDAAGAAGEAASTEAAAHRAFDGPVRRHDTLGYNTFLGVFAGARGGRRDVGPLGVPEDRQGGEAAATGLGGLVGRFAGVAGRRATLGLGRRFLTPELFVALGLGGTRWTADGSVPARRGGFAAGAEGILRVGIVRAGPWLASPYVKGQVEQRFAAYSRDTAEGNFVLGALRGSVGLLGRTRHDTFVLLAGAALDGVAGAQRLGSKAAVLQLMAGAELGVYAHPRRHLSLGWVGDARATVLGEGRGGRRIDGRVTFDLMIGRAASERLKYVSLLAIYGVTEVRASPASSPIGSAGERRLGHAALLAVGVGFL